MIKKVKGGYRVCSEKGKPLSSVMTKRKAEERLQQIEKFKNRGNK